MSEVGLVPDQAALGAVSVVGIAIRSRFSWQGGPVRQLIPRADAAGSSDLVEDPFAVYRGERQAPPGRPWILGNMVSGIDGSAAVGGRVGGLSSPKDRELFVLLRSLADAVLIGAATVRTEGYGAAHLRYSRKQRVADGRPPTPPLAIVTRSLVPRLGLATVSPDTQVDR